MKNFILSICSLLLVNTICKANQKLINPKGPGLEISSTIKFNDERISDYTLIIYDENQYSDTLVVTKQKTIYIKLSYGHTYSMRYIKPGFHERVVMVDTKIDPAKQNVEMDFDYEIEMLAVAQTGNTLSDLPVAIIGYDGPTQKFIYSRTYHRQVRGKEIVEIDSENKL